MLCPSNVHAKQQHATQRNMRNDFKQILGDLIPKQNLPDMMLLGHCSQAP